MIKKLLLTAMLMASAGAHADFPDRPVTIYAPNPAGGPVDVVLRVIGAKLGQIWKQPVVVENRPGASGRVLASALRKAPADGYTLGMMVASSLTVVPHAADNLPYDTKRDFTPISQVARTPFVFVVAPNSPIKTWQDFVALSKQKDLSIGSFALGSAFHLVWEQTARAANIKAVYAPSDSSGTTLGDVVGGRLDIALDAPSSARGMLDAGRVRAIAITSPTRFSGLPNVPTLSESGLPGYSAEPWFGLMAPKGTPPAVIDRIRATVVQALADPEVKSKMEAVGMTPVGSTPEEFGKIIDKDFKEMGPLVKELGIKL